MSVAWKDFVRVAETIKASDHTEWTSKINHTMNELTRKATPEERAANESALARLQQAYPNLGDNDIHDFLMNATAYPAASLPYCVDQAMKLVERSGGDWNKACDIALDDLFASMAA